MNPFASKLTEEERLSKAVVAIMGNPKYTALAGILMIGERKIVEDHPTAYTNGRDEGYGRAFVASLSDAELRFLVLHENYHKLYRHLITWKHLWDEDHTLANISCDHVINIKIVDDNKDGFATMTGPLERGCFDEQFRGMDSAEVYRILKLNQPPNKPQGGNKVVPGPGSFDDHLWDDAEEMSEDDQRELARDIDEAIRQGALVAGKMGTGADRELEELLKAQVDWREELREFITDTCAGNDFSTWDRPNRRFLAQDIYMPRGATDKVGELVVAIDTSGSIGARELSTFLGEVAGICDTVRPDKLRILYWDTEIRRDEVYEMDKLDDIAKSTKPAGGGGTDVECVPQYMLEFGVKPQAAIILTDGYLWGSWGQWTCPTLWCVLDNKGAKPPVGKTVHIKSREM